MHTVVGNTHQKYHLTTPPPEKLGATVSAGLPRYEYIRISSVRETVRGVADDAKYLKLLVVSSNKLLAVRQ